MDQAGRTHGARADWRREARAASLRTSGSDVAHLDPEPPRSNAVSAFSQPRQWHARGASAIGVDLRGERKRRAVDLQGDDAAARTTHAVADLERLAEQRDLDAQRVERRRQHRVDEQRVGFEPQAEQAADDEAVHDAGSARIDAPAAIEIDRPEAHTLVLRA